MITLKQWMEVCNYRITEGSEYCWECYGSNAYRLDSWNGDQDGHTISIIFDTRTQEVYEVTAYDYKRERAYRMINPAYRDAFNEEVKSRDVTDEAWEDDYGNPVKYNDLETEDDYIEKATAICNDEEYDTRIEVPLTLNDDELYQLMKLAHERDVTLNTLVEEMLVEFIETKKQEIKPKKKKGKK